MTHAVSPARPHARRSLAAAAVLLVALLGLPPGPAGADNVAQPVPFAQNWTNTGLITVNDDWSGVPGIIGYRGDALVGSPGADPQTIVADGSATPVDVNANQPNPNAFTTGGVAEFDTIADPTVALQGSGTADAPHLVLHLDTTGASNINVAYNLRDIDGAADNAIQQVALQFRVGGSGNYTNVAAGYVADATTGPSQATLVTPVSVTLPAAADNQSLVEVRVITADAAGSDEWVGVDDISITTGGGDAAPSVTSTDPANNATGIAVDSNLSVTFSEPVNVSGTWFSISCGSSGAHTATASGGPSTFTLDPDNDFSQAETCTITIESTLVTDQDTADPPDEMAADHVFDFQTVGPQVEIAEIQGAAHVSPLRGSPVSAVQGIVTAERSNGFWMQDPTPDSDDATSDGIFVFTSSAPTVNAGDDVSVSGRVDEFRAGGESSTNLTLTEIVSPTVIIDSSGNPLPAATVVGTGGRMPPTTVIEDDATGSVETSGVFDPANDGIDFYESLEAMRLQLNDAVASGPTNDFGEISVLPDGGAWAGLRTNRGGIIVRQSDFNPERIFLDDVLASTPNVNVGDHFTTSIVGVLDYSFGNFKLYSSTPVTRVDEGLAREFTASPTSDQIAVATLNVENLDPGDAATKFHRLADIVVTNLRSPDVITLEEVQDNNGPTNDSATDANVTLDTFAAAIQAAGGPSYAWRQINPVDDQDGGEPGGNIRVAFLFRTDRGITFVDRPGGASTTATTVVSGPSGPELSASPGRIDPTNTAFNTSRKPLVGEFRWNGRPLFVVANHFNSKGGDDPLFGRFQPPTLHTEVQRIQQAEVVNDFIDDILALDASANVAVAGDFNDFPWSPPLQELLDGGELNNLSDTLPENERYSYVFEGNSQQLDHILASDNLLGALSAFDIVHVNSEFFDQASDHEPSVARFATASPGCDPELTGSSNNDTIVGTPGPDHICGRGGDDTIVGLGGDDIIEGGNGNDTIDAGDGNDEVHGGNGNEVIEAGDGNDEVHGGNGNEVIEAGDGNDLVHGDGGNDEIDAGPGDDEVHGGSGDDTIIAGAGDDEVSGNDGNDHLDTQDGMGGNDTANGGRGTDSCTADVGDTVISCP